VITKKEIVSAFKNLEFYRRQLLARHKEEPLKEPPLFILDAVIADLKNAAKRKL
jgi:hypothetical protein